MRGSDLRVIIAGGGTGGHLFPGIAVAQELRRRTGAAVTFIGSDYGIERSAVPRAGFEIDLLSIRGIRGEGWAGALRALWRVPASVWSAARFLRRRRPELVIGVGGYASFPAVAAAALRRVPIVLLEQNARAGLATRVLAPLATRLCVSFAESAAQLGPKAVVTGNPVRALRGSGPRASDVEAAHDVESGAAGTSAAAVKPPFRLLVFGGSAGAHRLNVVVPEALAAVGRPVSVLHQAGEADRALTEESYRRLGIAADVRSFIDDMETAYAQADLIVCRAGATTIAELTALGLAAILIPYPFAAGDHQRLNAETLVDAGAAWMILDRELSPERLAGLVRRVIDEPSALAAARARSRELGHPDAAASVVDECLAVLGSARKEAAA